MDFIHLEQAYFDWLKKASPEDRLRWKYYSRWIHETASRTDQSGQPGNQSSFFRTAIKIQQSKSSTNHRKIRASNWIPLGPSTMPVPTQDFMISGKGRINTMAFHPTDPDILFAGTSQGGVWKTTNDGQTWFPFSDQLPILRISDIAVHPDDPDIIYISVGDMAYVGIALELDNRKRNTHYGLGVYKTIDGGENWFPTGLTFEQLEKDFSITRRVIIHPVNTDHLVAAGFHGIWTSANAGETWTKTNDQMIWDIEQDPTNPDILYISTAYVATLGKGRAGIMKSVDFGETWIDTNLDLPVIPEVQRIELSISPQIPETLYAVACNLNGGLYGVYKSSNGGTDWVHKSSQPNILHWHTGQNNNGQGTYDLTILVDPEDTSKVYIGGVNVWMSEDSGINWSGVSFYTNDHGESIHADQHFFARSPHTGEIYICNDGGIFRTDKILPGSWDQAVSDSNYHWPTKWEQISGTIVNTSFYRLSTSQKNPEHVFSGAQDLGTFYNRTGQWEYNLFGDGMECIIHPENDQIIYGSTQFSVISKSTDGGSTFQGVIAGVPLWDSEFPAWTTPYLLNPNNPGELFIALSNIWYTQNDGESWNTLPPMPNQFPSSAMVMSRTSPWTMYVSKRLFHSQNQDTELYRITQSGNTWSKRDNGLPDSLFLTYLAIDEDNPEKVWATFGGFGQGLKVFYSENSGVGWKNISKNLPNIPVNCIARHEGIGSNPLYVGTDIGVYYTNDTMDTWELYSDQLPNVIVTELEINNPFQKIVASTFGRGIWINDLVDEINTSVDRQILDQIQWKIYPNPVHTGADLNIHLTNINADNIHLAIVDISGRLVHREDLRITNSLHHHTIQIQEQSGLYFLVLRSGSSSITKKIMVR